MKTCAVMQPYLFPYIGYYQLVYASDVFVIYDDVTFIKQSYINRNSILVNEKAQRFTLPVPGSSSNTVIQELSYVGDRKILKTIQQAYRKAPFYNDVIELIVSVFESEERNVAKLNEKSLQLVFEYLGLDKKFVFASELDYEREADRADRLINLSKMFNCDHYINSPGGKELYDKKYFGEQGVQLNFIESQITPYQQFSSEFVPYLSMIDILMNCSKEQIIRMFSNFRLT
ncbi:hypothetical protein THIAE_04285 [Thiomicrospira aerophila AL3]|uniref:WbqC-like protein n=1 Tax=Thiomicrospira aerophila AL3 TaxID=717772 RepID=W0DVV2_9GAMM|nr:WbqC family protein [Thiomicrospira aerophila]AHF01114.1 hypothetical protein THIAE_04285 [Thiomicrospira aerophila AL3]